VITLNAPLTLRASYLPLPPSSSSPCSHSSSLITTLVAKHMVYRGVSTQLPLIKIIGILILQLTLSVLLFSSLLLSRTFFAIPLAEKMHSFFLSAINPKILLSRFFLCYDFYSSLMNMPITYIEEIETTLLTLLAVSLVLLRGKVDSAHNNPCFITSPSEFTNF
jgi:hypothetical protein